MMGEQETKPGLNEGIDLKEVFKQIGAGRKTIFVCMAVAFVVAVLVVLVTPKQYTTKVTLLTESASKSGASGLLSQLGGMSGINMGGLSGLMGGSSGSDALTPELYPDIVKSTPFLLEVLCQNVTESKRNKTITVANYLENENQSPLTGLMGLWTDKPLFAPITKPDPKVLLKLTKRQMDLANGLANIINLNVESLSGGGLTGGGSKIITVSIELQDPVVSAQLADLVVSNLKNYIVDYNTGKAKKDLDFIKTRYNEARDKYYSAQQTLAHHNDRNLNVILESVNTSKQRLETENVLAANIYNSLAQSLEQAKMKVQDQTPAFTVIEPAQVPLTKSKPKSIVILMGLLFVGAFIGVGVVFVRRK
jgi:capsular polysaccharide biosynthesis protein